MQLDQLRRSSLLGPSDLKLPDRKLSKRSMPPTAEPMISDQVLNHPHVPIVDGTDSIDEVKPRKTVNMSQAPAEVIVPSGGSSPHGLDMNYSFQSSSSSREERTTNEYEHSPSTKTGRVEIGRNM